MKERNLCCLQVFIYHQEPPDTICNLPPPEPGKSALGTRLYHRKSNGDGGVPGEVSVLNEICVVVVLMQWACF